MCNYLCYDYLSTSYQKYIIVISVLKEPTTYSEDVKDEKLVDAMETEIQAPGANRT